jgi:hypothetical protein
VLRYNGIALSIGDGPGTSAKSAPHKPAPRRRKRAR